MQGKMSNHVLPNVDVILLTRRDGPLHPVVENGIRAQRGIELVLYRIVGEPRPDDRCRYETIARARNEGRLRGNASWLMFVDDDVVLDPQCAATLVGELSRRSAFGALAADYLGEQVSRRIAVHVSMGATLFRREAIQRIHFRWRQDRCECQCCCDDLRRHFWAIDYCPSAKARHLFEEEIMNHGGAFLTVTADGDRIRHASAQAAEQPLSN
jgi:hypothetical protein